MCGRVVASSSREYFGSAFDVTETIGDELPASYNVAPQAFVYAIVDTPTSRRLGVMQWGLVPSWAADPDSGPRPINARSETLLDKAQFASALERRRCVLPVDGFYEWEKLPDGRRQPYFISAIGGGPLALAGLWDRWVAPDGDALVTCTIVTTAANRPMSELHDRMPAILDAAMLDDWLDPALHDPLHAAALLEPARDDLLGLAPANPRANNAANDGPDLLEPDPDLGVPMRLPL
jgi:putative SOS response-associated peptidase YedK